MDPSVRRSALDCVYIHQVAHLPRAPPLGLALDARHESQVLYMPPLALNEKPPESRLHDEQLCAAMAGTSRVESSLCGSFFRGPFQSLSTVALGPQPQTVYCADSIDRAGVNPLATGSGGRTRA